MVAGSSVLVVAFVALNLLAQYFGQLRASGGLDHYATLPVPPAAVVLGAAGAYASFTVPGTLVTAVVGCVLFHLPFGGLWVLVAVVPLAGAALSGLGAALGLLAPRQELATLAGQLGMSAALLLGVLPAGAPAGPDRLGPRPAAVHLRRGGVRPAPSPRARTGRRCSATWRCAPAVGVASLALATWAYRRAALPLTGRRGTRPRGGPVMIRDPASGTQADLAGWAGDRTVDAERPAPPTRRAAGRARRPRPERARSCATG